MAIKLDDRKILQRRLGSRPWSKISAARVLTSDLLAIAVLLFQLQLLVKAGWSAVSSLWVRRRRGERATHKRVHTTPLLPLFEYLMTGCQLRALLMYRISSKRETCVSRNRQERRARFVASAPRACADTGKVNERRNELQRRQLLLLLLLLLQLRRLLIASPTARCMHLYAAQ